ncbi:D-amino acid dehydrogenase small subunit [Pandoraea terrae]|uniref:D-amino acid dehydrogenase small subunit n=1 Tax=Pandoraea terrae TaxID=1537710 RepID=A0A5E4W8V2_9BURK|nr:D-amino acid dehydrogenase [Pandoraea terrae]VVE21417.1 D-amino acid dehydrogenase small subunit [Pandoraea terrae]
MPHILVLGAGITGVTTAYTLAELGYSVTVIDRHRYAAMETSFANGGQLSACNAEVWNSTATILKGLKWMLRRDAPLLLNPAPSWHKYSWLGEFVGGIAHHRENTIETVRLAIAARARMFEIAEREGIDFDLEKRGILHFYHDAESFSAAVRGNTLLTAGGLERYAVTPEEITAMEPALQGRYHGGFYTPSDATGDIHKFTRGLADACRKRGVTFHHGVIAETLRADAGGVRAILRAADPLDATPSDTPETIEADALVVCAGVGSRDAAGQLGDRINVYPVKGYSITVHLDDEASVAGAPWVSLLDESAKIVTSRLGASRFRVAGTAEFNGYNRDIRADRVEPLVQWVRRNFRIDTSRVVSWAGLRPMMPDMMPRVMRGRAPRVFYNTGHGHLGWTLSAATSASLGALVSQHLPA